MNARELLNALDAFEQEKGISKDVVLGSKRSLRKSIQKTY